MGDICSDFYDRSTTREQAYSEMTEVIPTKHMACVHCSLQFVKPQNNPYCSEYCMTKHNPSGPRLWDEFGWNENVGNDPVDKPEHYNHGSIECIVYMKDNMTTEAFQGYLEGCAKKYMHRFRYKGKAKQDLQKAQWYLNKLIEEQE